jgi:hypothetical protein
MTTEEQLPLDLEQPEATAPQKAYEQLPFAYRLCVKANGNLNLQGAVRFQLGEEVGADWFDLETVIEVPAEPAPAE